MVTPGNRIYYNKEYFSWYCPKCGYVHETPICTRGSLPPRKIATDKGEIKICPYCDQEIKE